MQVKPIGSPVTPRVPTASEAKHADARARAISKFMGQAPGQAPGQEAPVPNPSQISPEEFSAVKAPTPQEAPSALAEASNAAPEAPAAEPEKPKEDPLSSQYATLARKEKALRQQIEKFKAEQAKFEADRLAAQSAPKAPEIDLSKYIDKDKLKADPLSAFADIGLSYDELTEAILNRGQVQTDPRVNAQLAKLESQIQEAREENRKLREAQEESQKQSYQQAINQIRSEASKLAYGGDTFEMIKATNSVGDVVELIESTFKSEGILLSVEEACQAVEDHLLEEAVKLSKVKKLQQKLTASAAPSKPVTKQEQPQPTPAKTLTNGMTAAKPMSARERAIAAMEGRLRK